MSENGLAAESATRPNQRELTDLMQVLVEAGTHLFISFMDEYPRYIMHQEVLRGVDGGSTSLAARAAIAS